MKKINWQIFISFNLLFTFIFMLLSGVILYVKPEGSVARWIGWRMLFLSKSSWESLHTVFSFLFTGFALFHILRIHLYNFFIYLNRKHHFAWREFFIAALLSVAVLVGASFQIQPFHGVYQIGNRVSGMWNTRAQRPNPDISSSSTLQEIATFSQVSVRDLIRVLDSAGFSNPEPTASIAQIAKQQGVTSEDVYQRMSKIMNHLEQQVLAPYGGITLGELAFAWNLEPQKIIRVIKSRWALDSVEAETSVQNLADRTGQSCEEIRSTIHSALNKKKKKPEHADRQFQ